MTCIGVPQLRIIRGSGRLVMRMAVVAQFGRPLEPLQDGGMFSTELEWVGDLNDLENSLHTIARYIRSLGLPDEKLIDTAMRLA